MLRVALLLSVLTPAAGQGSPQQPPVTFTVGVIEPESVANLFRAFPARELEFRIR